MFQICQLFFSQIFCLEATLYEVSLLDAAGDVASRAIDVLACLSQGIEGKAVPGLGIGYGTSAGLVENGRFILRGI
jgi:hypothetical protein